MMPSCDQIGVPIHFHSSTTSGSASLMSLRILLRVSPRQSPSSAILFEMSSDADWRWLASDFFIFTSNIFHPSSSHQFPSSSLHPGQPGKAMLTARSAFAGVACTERQKKYERPQSTLVAAAQPHASGPSPTERCAMSAEPRVMAKPE